MEEEKIMKEKYKYRKKQINIHSSGKNHWKETYIHQEKNI
jgi:hypothetical protein